jgi:hypothetical protein
MKKNKYQQKNNNPKQNLCKKNKKNIPTIITTITITIKKRLIKIITENKSK